MRRLDASKRPGKPCGRSFIAAEKECHLTPASVAAPKGSGGNWRRRVAIGAGVTAGALAVGLPAAGFFMSGSPQGRRRSMRAERVMRGAASAMAPWGGPVAMPLSMGLQAGAEGIAATRSARRRVESWRAAPGFAREASRLGAAKAAKSQERSSYIEAMRQAWARGERTPSAAEVRRREAQMERERRRSEALARQAAVRMRAGRRAARIARTGAPFRSSPTPLEAALRRGLANPSPGVRGAAERAGASLTAGMLRQLQQTRGGPNRRRVRFYQ